MRLWVSGPRILGGLVRPGISFGSGELSAPNPPKLIDKFATLCIRAGWIGLCLAVVVILGSFLYH